MQTYQVCSNKPYYAWCKGVLADLQLCNMRSVKGNEKMKKFKFRFGKQDCDGEYLAPDFKGQASYSILKSFYVDYIFVCLFFEEKLNKCM